MKSRWALERHGVAFVLGPVLPFETTGRIHGVVEENGWRLVETWLAHYPQGYFEERQPRGRRPAIACARQIIAALEAASVADNSTAAGRQQNRRVEIIVSGEVIGAKIGK